MEDKIWTKEVSAGKRSSAISDREEHKISERQGNAKVFKTHHIGTATVRVPGKQRQDSQIQSNTTERFPAVQLPAVYSECSADSSPLKGTPWEDAAIRSVTPKKQLGCKGSVKEQEHIEFWLNFFG